nr:MAG TPA: hypothetical protein [Caudoviricetes sp.]
MKMVDSLARHRVLIFRSGISLAEYTKGGTNHVKRKP